MKTIVDAKYYSHLMSVSKWYLHNNGRVLPTKFFHRNKQILHRYIMLLEGKLVDELEVDHIDRNPLNNVSSNLRMVTCQENKRNKGKRTGTSSKYIGVYWRKNTKKWIAQIKHSGKMAYIGSYSNEEDAARAYDDALRKLPVRDDVKVYNFS